MKARPKPSVPPRNKWASRRWWFAVWAAVVVSVIVLKPIPEAMTVASLLVGLVGVFIGGEAYNKKYLDPNSRYEGG